MNRREAIASIAALPLVAASACYYHDEYANVELTDELTAEYAPKVVALLIAEIPGHTRT